MAFTRRPDQLEDSAEISLALWGPLLDLDEPVSAERWPALRTRAWAAWEAALDEGVRTEGYPPDGAVRWDGIEGEVLRRRYGWPFEYIGGWDARPDIVTLAEKALEELAAAPDEVKAAIPARYEELVREALEHPETRLGANPFPNLV